MTLGLAYDVVYSGVCCYDSEKNISIGSMVVLDIVPGLVLSVNSVSHGVSHFMRRCQCGRSKNRARP